METKTQGVYPQRQFTQLKNRIKNGIDDYTKVSRSDKQGLFQFSFIFNFLFNELEEVEGVEDILGYSDSTLTFSSLFKFIHPDDSPFIYKGIKKILKNIYSYNPEHKLNISFLTTFRVKSAKGDYIHLLCQSSAQEVIDGYITKLSNVFVDISGLNLRPYSSVRLKLGNNQGFSECNIMVDNDSRYINLFSKREMAVLRLIAEGKKSCELAVLLGISVKTVNTHRRNILRKSKTNNIIEVVAILKDLKII
jgi:DNA-binding CsgD family transcriptional regulator